MLPHLLRTFRLIPAITYICPVHVTRIKLLIPQTTAMPLFGQTADALKKELSKTARLSKVTAALPTVLKPYPTIAIAVGGAIAAHTKGENGMESWLLGPEEAMQLGPPTTTSAAPVVTSPTLIEAHRHLANTADVMCGTCRSRRIGPGNSLLTTGAMQTYYPTSRYGMHQVGMLQPHRSRLPLLNAGAVDAAVFGLQPRPAV